MAPLYYSARALFLRAPGAGTPSPRRPRRPRRGARRFRPFPSGARAPSLAPYTFGHLAPAHQSMPAPSPTLPCASCIRCQHPALTHSERPPHPPPLAAVPKSQPVRRATPPPRPAARLSRLRAGRAAPCRAARRPPPPSAGARLRGRGSAAGRHRAYQWSMTPVCRAQATSQRPRVCLPLNAGNCAPFLCHQATAPCAIGTL
ncbi:MAG: hypothetical protein J3K34DRAFT_408764 [Monoraphidium minutum]|nr:MAG: hypothetical protein J3K34DRAFT_408764 [Monoraphidium minutum]